VFSGSKHGEDYGESYSENYVEMEAKGKSQGVCIFRTVLHIVFKAGLQIVLRF